MDKKQFDLFQSGVQWVWDDNKRRQAGRPHGGNLHHVQGLWVGGRIIDRIKAKWGEHRREMDLVCPTACCLAGNILITNGDRFVVDHEWDIGEQTTSVEYCLDEKDQVHGIQNRAMEVAGLNLAEAQELFEGGNTAESIVESATRIAKEHGYELEVL